MSLKMPKAVYSANERKYSILQQIEMSKYLEVVFTSDGSRNKGIDTWIGKVNVTLRGL